MSTKFAVVIAAGSPTDFVENKINLVMPDGIIHAFWRVRSYHGFYHLIYLGEGCCSTKTHLDAVGYSNLCPGELMDYEGGISTDIDGRLLRGITFGLKRENVAWLIGYYNDIGMTCTPLELSLADHRCCGVTNVEVM